MSIEYKNSIFLSTAQSQVDDRYCELQGLNIPLRLRHTLIGQHLDAIDSIVGHSTDST